MSRNMDENVEKKVKIACCIPTYQHAFILETILPYIIPMYHKYNIDIYIFDSSEDDETKKLVQKYQEKMMDGLFYLHLDSTIGGDEKYYRILQGFGLKKEYDYIFPIKDRVFLDENTIQYITEKAKTGADIILLPAKDRARLVQHTNGIVYQDKVLFFRDYGALTTSWETVLYRFDTMLRDVCWEEVEKKTPMGIDCPFNQTYGVFYFLSKKDAVTIEVLERHRIVRVQYQGVPSQWLQNAINIWAIEWPRVIGMLPDCYDEYKDQVIRDGVSIPALWGSLDVIYSYITEGILSKDQWNTIRNEWDKISVLPKEWVDLLMDHKTDEICDIAYETFEKLFLEEEIEEAYLIYLSLKYIGQKLGELDCTVNDIFEIYNLEHQEKNWNEEWSHFEEGCHSFQNYEDKCKLIKMLVQAIRDHRPTEEIAPLLQLKRQLRVSDIAMNYFMRNDQA